MSADLLARLIAAGTPASLVGEVAMALAKAEADREAIESRRSKDRERQSSRRHAMSRDVTGHHVTARDVTLPDPALDKESVPQTPFKEIKPTPSVCIASAREDAIGVPVFAQLAANRIAVAVLAALIARARERHAVETAVQCWNAMAKRVGLATVKSLTEERRKRLRARIADHGPDAFTEAIAAVERSSFCLGDSRGGWRADFDFLLQPSSFTKLIEGSYDRSINSTGNSRGQGNFDRPGRIRSASSVVFSG